MEELAKAAPRGYLEILDRLGYVAERVPLTDFPVSVGRAYDNDVIVADQYVCPHHLQLLVDDSSQIMAEDLGSVNGLFVRASTRAVPKVSLSTGTQIRIGHTVLRYRSIEFQVGETTPDRHTRKLLGAYENRIVQLAVFVLTLGVLLLSNYLDSVERREVTEPAFELVFPLAFILVWSGLWTFAGRVITHRIKFLVHCAIVCAALTTVFLFDTALDYLAFALDADELRTVVSVVGGLIIVSAVLYAHLRFSTLASPALLASSATAISFVVMGMLLLKGHIDRSAFNVNPQYQVTLKAPAFRLVPGESPDDFFGRIDTLRDGVVVNAQALSIDQ